MQDIILIPLWPRVWCFAEGIGLFKFNGKAFTFIGPLHNLPSKGLAIPNFYNRLVSFHEESPSILWLATSNVLNKFQTDKLKIEHVSSLSDDQNRPAFLHFLVSDGHRGFWCSTYGTGLIHFNPKVIFVSDGFFRNNQLDTLSDEIAMLAMRHDKYGVQPEHYRVVGECLIWTLSTGLSDKWNQETESSWVEAYTILAGAMIQNQTFVQERSKVA